MPRIKVGLSNNKSSPISPETKSENAILDLDNNTLYKRILSHNNDIGIYDKYKSFDEIFKSCKLAP